MFSKLIIFGSLFVLSNVNESKFIGKFFKNVSSSMLDIVWLFSSIFSKLFKSSNCSNCSKSSKSSKSSNLLLEIFKLSVLFLSPFSSSSSFCRHRPLSRSYVSIFYKVITNFVHLQII